MIRVDCVYVTFNVDCLSIGRVNPPNAEAGDVERTSPASALGGLKLLNVRVEVCVRFVQRRLPRIIGGITTPLK